MFIYLGTENVNACPTCNVYAPHVHAHVLLLRMNYFDEQSPSQQKRTA